MKAENNKGIVFIIDDDESVRLGLSMLLRVEGFDVKAYESALEFLVLENFNRTGCILLDVFMNGESGLELQDKIKEEFSNLPIIYMSGQGDIPMSVQALKKGAVNFLQKPIDRNQLIDAVEEALSISKYNFDSQNEQRTFKSLIDTLTQREYEIFRNVITGALNKQIAAKLDIAEHTVKLHRGKITEKLGVKSVADLIYIAEKLHLK
jgi:two-component system, LuxR family, response regulator FixJ